MHLLQTQFGSVVPVMVVQVLSDQRVGLNCSIGVNLYHRNIESYMMYCAPVNASLKFNQEPQVRHSYVED